MWSRFVPSDRLSGCRPAQERQGGKATHLQKTDPHASGRGEHTRGTQTKHKQKQFKDQPQHVLMYLLFPLQYISEGKYKSFEEFRADARLIVHNTAILHGGKTYKPQSWVWFKKPLVHFTQVSAWPIPHSPSTVNSDQAEIARLLYNDTCHEVRPSKQLEF